MFKIAFVACWLRLLPVLMYSCFCSAFFYCFIVLLSFSGIILYSSVGERIYVKKSFYLLALSQCIKHSQVNVRQYNLCTFLPFILASMAYSLWLLIILSHTRQRTQNDIEWVRQWTYLKVFCNTLFFELETSERGADKRTLVARSRQANVHRSSAH